MERSTDPFESAFAIGEVESTDQHKALDAQTAAGRAIIDTAFDDLENVVRGAVGDSTAFGSLSASEAEFPETKRHRYELQLAGSGQHMKLRITGCAAIIRGEPGVAPAVACDELSVEVSTVRDASIAHVGRGFEEGISNWFSLTDGHVSIDVEHMREMIRASVEDASRTTN